MLRLIDCHAETCEHMIGDPCACNGTGRKVAICQYCEADLREGESDDACLACVGASFAVAVTREQEAVAGVRIRYTLFPPLPQDRGAAAIETFLRVNDVRQAVLRWQRESA